MINQAAKYTEFSNDIQGAQARQKYIYESEIKKNALLQIKNYSDNENKVIPFF